MRLYKGYSIKMKSQTLFEEYQVVFVHPCPEEGSENMRFIVNVASPPSASSQRHHKQVICPYVPLTSAALCGASTSVSFVLSEFTCVLCLGGVAKHVKCFLKSAKLILSTGHIKSNYL